MPTLTLLIDGQEADYFDRDDFPLVLRRQAVDYKDPAARKGDHTWTLKLPFNTSRNRRIFGNLHLPAKTDKFSSLRELPTEVWVDGVRLVKGRFVIRAVTFVEIEGYIVASVRDFSADIRGRSLRDLDLGGIDFKGWSTMLDSIYAQVYNLNEEGAVNSEAVVCYPIVSYGNPFLPNRWTAGLDVDVTDWSPLYGETFALPVPKEIYGRDTYKLELASSFHLGFQDVPPCVYVVEILKAMFAAVGWTLRGAWLNSEAARRLVMPYVGDRPYIYNWELLASGIYETGQDNAIVLRAAQDFDLEILGTRVKVWSFRNVTSGVGSYAQSYYKTSVPLGGTVNLPLAGGGQLLDNWRTYIRVLPLETQNVDYGFSRHTRRFATHPGDNPNDPFDTYRSDLYVAPVDGLYNFSFVIDIGGLNDGTLLDETATPTPFTWNTDIAGLRFAVGVSKIPGGGDIPAALDGEFTIRQDLTGPGAENVLAAQVVTADGNVSLLADNIRLNRGDALAFWVAMTSPYAPDVGTDPRGTLLSFASKVGPYTPFAPNQTAYTFSAQIGYTSVYVTVQCQNLPETPEPDRFGALLQPGQNLPDVQQIDFLKSLISLFNLWLDVDADARTVTLQTADDFFLPAASALDLTERTARTGLTIRPPELGRYGAWVWNLDGDDFLTAERGATYDVFQDFRIRNNKDTTTIDSGVFASTEFADYRLVKAIFEAPEFIAVEFADSPYTIADDVFYVRVNVDASGGAVTVELPAAPTEAMRISVKDYYGLAATNNITVSGNGFLIDGAATRTLDTAFAVEEYVFDGAAWTQSFEDSLNDAWATPAFVPVSTMRVPVLANKDALFRLQNEEGAPNYAYTPRLLSVWRAPLTNPASYTEGVPVRVFDPTEPLGERDYLDRLQNYIMLNFADTTITPRGAPQPTLAWNGDEGLYVAFYRNLFAAIARGEEAEGVFRLKPADVQRLQINRPIVIDGVVYYLKEMKNYNPVTQSPTTLVLIRR